MDFEQKTISYYDSMGEIERSYVHGRGTEIPTGLIHAPSQKIYGYERLVSCSASERLTTTENGTAGLPISQTHTNN